MGKIMNSLQLFLYLFFFASLIVSSTQNSHIKAAESESTGTCTSRDNNKKLYEFMLEFKPGKNDKFDGICGDGFDVTVTKDGSGEKGVNFTYTEVENYKNKCNSNSKGDKFICYIYFSNIQSLKGTIFKGNVMTLNGKSKDEKCELTNRTVEVTEITGGYVKDVCGYNTIEFNVERANCKCKNNTISYFRLEENVLAKLNELKFEIPVNLSNHDKTDSEEINANCTKKVDDKYTECTINTEVIEKVKYWRDGEKEIAIASNTEYNITDFPGFTAKIVSGGTCKLDKCGIKYDELEFAENYTDGWDCNDDVILFFELHKLNLTGEKKFNDEIKLKDSLEIENPKQSANCSIVEDHLKCIIIEPKMKKGEMLVIPKQSLKAEKTESDGDINMSYQVNYPGITKVIETKENCIKEERQGSYSVPTKKSGLSGGAIAGICVGAGVLILGALAAALLCSKGASIPAIPQAIPPSAPLVNTPMAQMPKFHDAPLPPKVDIAPTYSSVHPLPKPQVSQLVYQVPGYSMPVYQGPPIYEEPIVNIQGSNLVPDPHFQVSMAQVGEVPIVNPTHNSQFAYI